MNKIAGFMGAFALLLTALSSTQPAAAQSAGGQRAAAQRGGAFTAPGLAGTIDRIVIEGTQRIDPETVLTYMTVREGDVYDAGKVDRSLKNLFETGLFADVSMRHEGGRLVVSVAENPIINRIAFEGNRRIKDPQLETEIQLRPRVVYTRAKVQEDVQRILELYRRSGRYAVSVEPKVIALDQNRVDLAFEINEGPSTTVRRISFVGNKVYDDSALREVVETSEEAWYRFLSSTDTYDPDRLTYDRELLRRHYLKNGYADFQVKSAVAELSTDRQAFFMTFTVSEGERYRFGPVGLETTLAELDPEILRGVITFKDGDWYSADKVEAAVQKLTDEVGNRGFAFVDVKPRVTRDADKRTIAITFQIDEGPRAFVERIDINGNVRTLDEVVRREMMLSEGDAFNAAKLRRSRQRIQDLGFFEKVEVNNEPSPTAPDRTVVKVDVTEKSTGEVSFGVGWSSSVGAIIEVGLRERNLLGRGQDLKASVSWAQRRSQVDISFTEPYFLDRRLRAGVDLYAIKRNLKKESSYDYRTYGTGLRLGYNYNENLGHTFKYTAEFNEITDVKSDASRFIKNQDDKTYLSMIGHVLTYDRRDSKLDPKDGYVLSLGNDLAGLGGSEYFLRSDAKAAYYAPIGDWFDWNPSWGLTVKGGAGYMFGLGKDVNINQRYNLGGTNLRGFANAGASPRDADTDDALGGNWVTTGSVEVAVPLGLPAELGLSGRLFSDFGMIGKPDDFDEALMDGAVSPRLSAGAGVTWVSPVGPISVDLGYPLVKEKFDKTEVFRLSFGSRF
ncbi:outer membrane protein assembly factor BamA [Rhodospirillum rubrum]|nr:outer membrane protein assembly factor BamA [Rhodospirillum rubrum]MBK1675097.1 outer membrane protein assembly factor BamA [Rhodospirillum rubrum]